MSKTIQPRRAMLSTCFGLGALALAGGCGGGGNEADAGAFPDGAADAAAILADSGEADTGGGADAAAADSGPLDAAPRKSFVYVESNEPKGNAVLGFETQPDGTLAAIGRFTARGPGLSAGPNQRRGPLDSDRNLALSSDARFLFAVNSGGSSIAVFSTHADGSLSGISGSPFSSGGDNPVSVAVFGSRLLVVNKAVSGHTTPSYVARTINEGALFAIPGGAVRGQNGGSPSIAALSADGTLLFGTEFFDQARASSAPVRQLDAFLVEPSGALKLAPGAPGVLPAVSGGSNSLAVALNLAVHPVAKLLYVGFPTRNQIGIYSYDASGVLSFQRTVQSSGRGVARFLMSKNLSWLYAVNQDSATLSQFDISNPTRPVEISAIALKGASSGLPFVDAAGAMQTVTSQPFQLAFDPDEAHIYLVSQRVTTNPVDVTGNLLHVLDVDIGGGLSETIAPLDLRTVGVSTAARPQGVVVFTP
jgi:hypothetical protein